MKLDDWNIAITRREWLGGAAALGACAVLPALPARAQAIEWPNLTRLLSSYVEPRKVANMVAVIGFGDDDPTVIATGVDSFTGTRRSNAGSIYRIHSMTKPVTGMAAISLIDEGKLGLDQPLHEILPAFRNMQVQKVYDGPITADNLEPAVRAITIRHLLTHTAGLSYGIVQSGPIAEASRARGIIPGLATRLQALPVFRGTPVRGLANFVDGLAELPLVYQPGTKWSYSTAFEVLGRVIEVVSGQPFESFLQERFFGPLAMTDTHFQVPRDKSNRMTTSYLLANGALLPIDLGSDSIYFDELPLPFGGAGLASTPHDYDQFLRMLVNGGEIGARRVMSEAAIRLGTSNLMPDTLVPGGEYNPEWDYGAGGRVGREGPYAGAYGWAGAAGTIGFISPALGLRAGLYTQYMPSMAYPLMEEFPAAILSDIGAVVPA